MTAVMAVQPSRWLGAQGASGRWSGGVHLENEMVARRQQTIDCHARRQQGKRRIEQRAASGYGRECSLNVVIATSLVIRVHRKCGRTRNHRADSAEICTYPSNGTATPIRRVKSANSRVAYNRSVISARKNKPLELLMFPDKWTFPYFYQHLQKWSRIGSHRLSACLYKDPRRHTSRPATRHRHHDDVEVNVPLTIPSYKRSRYPCAPKPCIGTCCRAFFLLRVCSQTGRAGRCWSGCYFEVNGG